MKVFLTGSEGALGSEFSKSLVQHEVLALKEAELDLTRFKTTVDAVTAFRPDIVCHLAAISDVDGCEKNKESAYQVNVIATYNVATAANLVGAKILYISTNYVFDGRQSDPYFEWDRPNPVNEYGRTKLLGEEVVRSLTHRYFIVRTSWLFGKNSKTFASRFVENREKPKEMRVITDQQGSFTYTKDLSALLTPLLETSYYGIYHLVNKGKASWFDFLTVAKKYLNFSTEIRQVKLAELSLSAQRPVDAELGSRCYEGIFGQTMRRWEEALLDFVKSIR